MGFDRCKLQRIPIEKVIYVALLIDMEKNDEILIFKFK